jgi:opacity protein-like surface antigen
MKKLIASLIAAAIFPSVSFAFEGFSAGANLNFINAATKLTASGTTVNLGGPTSQFASLQAAYGFATGKDLILSVGGSYGLSDVKAGGVTGYDFKGKNIWQLYLEPGVKMNPTTLAYGKIAYSGMKGVLTTSTTSDSENVKGWGYGAGVRFMTSPTMFWQVEFIQTNYDEKTEGALKYKPSATTGTIGLGFKF